MKLVGGWTKPFEKYVQVKLEHFPSDWDENKKKRNHHHLGKACKSPLHIASKQSCVSIWLLFFTAQGAIRSLEIHEFIWWQMPNIKIPNLLCRIEFRAPEKKHVDQTCFSSPRFATLRCLEKKWTKHIPPNGGEKTWKMVIYHGSCCNKITN